MDDPNRKIIREARLKALGLYAPSEAEESKDNSVDTVDPEITTESNSQVAEIIPDAASEVEVVTSNQGVFNTPDIQSIVSKFFGTPQDKKSIVPIIIVMNPSTPTPLPQVTRPQPVCSAPAASVPTPPAEQPQHPSVSIDLTTPPASPPHETSLQASPPLVATDRGWIRTLWSKSPTPEFLSTALVARPSIHKSRSRSPRRNQLQMSSVAGPSRCRSRSRYHEMNHRQMSPVAGPSRHSSRSRSPQRNQRHYRSPEAGPSRNRSRSRSPSRNHREISPVAAPSRRRSPSPQRNRELSPEVGPARQTSRSRSPEPRNRRQPSTPAGPASQRLRSLSSASDSVESQPKKRGRPKGSKNKVPTSHDEPQCAVCFDEKGPFVSTSCGHLCHEKCLKKWMKVKKEEHNYRKTCPFCGKMYTQYFNLYY